MKWELDKRICRICNKEQPIENFYLFGDTRTRICDDCRRERQLESYYKSKEQKQNKKIEEKAKAKKDESKKLEELNSEALNAGMSYGKYVALKSMGKI